MSKTRQTIIIEKLTFLVPNAILSVRPYDNNEHLVQYPVIRGDMLIDWHPGNGDCPSLEAIEAVTEEQVNAKLEADRKKARDEEKMNDLTLVALFDAEKKQKHNLSFSEYLDELEQKQHELKQQEKENVRTVTK